MIMPTPDTIRLVHSVPCEHLPSALKNGLKAHSAVSDLDTELRCNVVYCWLRVEDDKLSSSGQRSGYTYVEVTVATSRCIVADMEWSSLALMYHQGQGRPSNPRAAQLLAELYEATAVPVFEYKPGMFFTPEVLVKEDIEPEALRLLS